MDKNANRVCDAGEPFATSTAGGAYQISGLAAADVDQYPIAVEATTASTTDEDTGAKVAANFTLSAPKGLKDAAGKYNVTPITALMHQHLIANPAQTNAQAETTIKTALGISAPAGASLVEDFVAKKATDAANYKPLYQVAQVITRVMQEAQTSLGANATPALVAAQVQNTMAEILTTATTAGNFAADGKITAAASNTILAGTGSVTPIDAIRTTEFGKVAGVHDTASGAYAWLGIPYAAPPIGNLRWKKPANPAAWTEIKATKQFGSACMQKGSVWGPQPAGQAFGLSLKNNFDQIVGSEDCLTLNIWQPDTKETNLPVLVFIHGGSNIVGWSGTPDYWGANFAKAQKAVVVTINYRLNLFGWMSHAALADANDAENDSGNFGTLDQIQALKFIKNNIANFGGDPTNVTISGQSAGGLDVWALMSSPKAAGLFHKAMPMSGGVSIKTKASSATYTGVLLRWLVYHDSGKTFTTQQITDKIAADYNTPEKIKAYLYSKTAEQLLAANNDTSLGSANAASAYFGALLGDGVVLPPDTATALTGNYLNNVPVIAGVTRHEGKVWGGNFAGLKTPAQLWEYQWNFNPDAPSGTIADLIQAAYLPVDKPFVDCANTGYEGRMRNISCNGGFNTQYFWYMSESALNKYRLVSSNVYAYEFDWAQQPEPWKTFYGANHVADVAFVFGNFGPGLYSSGYSTANKPGRVALSNLMQKSIKAFMMTGNPNISELGVTWPTWPTGGTTAKRMGFNADNNAPQIGISTTTWQTL